MLSFSSWHGAAGGEFRGMTGILSAGVREPRPVLGEGRVEASVLDPNVCIAAPHPTPCAPWSEEPGF